MERYKEKIDLETQQKTIRVLFRIAGGKAVKKELGMGHVFRSMSLASEFKKNNVFFLVEDYGGVKKILLENGFKNIIYLRKGIKSKEDVEKTCLVLKRKKIDVLIIDKYGLKDHYPSNMKKYVKTIVISDLKNITYHADLLVNGFIGYENEIRKNKFGTKCLLGPKYQIINKKFTKMRKNFKRENDFLATFGGFDELNIAGILLRAIMNTKKPLKTKLILGPTSLKKNYEKEIKQNKKFIEIMSYTNNMFYEMQKTKFGICSGGITTYEFAALRIPMIIICQNKHQTITAKKWEEKNMAINLGIATSQTYKKIIDVLDKMSTRKFNKKKLIDGLATKRVTNEILNRLK